MTTSIICPICGSTAIENEHFKNDSFTGKFCQKCHTVFAWPIPTQEFLNNWYAQPTTLTSVETMEDDKLHIDAWKRKEVGLSTSKLLRAGAKGRVLDVGCHYGVFAHEMQQRGLDVTGIDPNPEAVKFAREYYDLKAEVETIDTLSSEPAQFDVVTMWDVIEHLADPVGALKKLNHVLSPFGLIGLGTPNRMNVNHLFTNATRGFRNIPLGSPLDPPRHLYGFDRYSMEVALNLAGFDVVNAWTLDTYERYDGSEFKLPYRLAYGVLYEAGRALDAGDRLFVIARKRSD